MKLVEGRSGMWFYHLSDHPDCLVALCGAATMTTSAGIDSWGVVTHVGERYCAECARLGGM
ncbi:hypothetical protein [Nocardia niwae]|uniref:hypothetical protein n=1 Tax=Nocardia niwae TaxID=626084 RepID=UPI0007A41479|nr:hypothetical protein [Nocardia niwae]